MAKIKGKIKSKKFVVYFYQGGKGGGNIFRTNDQGLLVKEGNTPFCSKEHAMELFGALIDNHLHV